MTFARSPVIPKTTRTSATRCSGPAVGVVRRVLTADGALVVIAASSFVGRRRSGRARGPRAAARSRLVSLRPVPGAGSVRFLLGPNGDTARPLVREPCPGPVDERLGAILTGREEREMHGPPGERRGLALDRPSAVRLDHGGPPADGRHRALVVVREGLGGLAAGKPRDVFPC